MALADLLTAVGNIMTSIISWATQVVGFITSNPLILLFVVTGIAGYAFITVKSFLHR
jgi:hypothetical protein